MVNYLTAWTRSRKNHEAFVRDHRVVASTEIRKLVREYPGAKTKAAEEKTPEPAAKPAS